MKKVFAAVAVAVAVVVVAAVAAVAAEVTLTYAKISDAKIQIWTQTVDSLQRQHSNTFMAVYHLL